MSSSFPHSIWLDVDPVKRAPNLPSVIKSSITSAPLGGELGSVEQFRYCWGQLFFLLRKTTRPYFPGGHWIQILSESTLGQQRTDKSSRFGSGNCFVVCLCPSSVTCLKSSTSNKEREKKGVQPGCVFHWSSAAGRFVSYDMLVKFCLGGKNVCWQVRTKKVLKLITTDGGSKKEKGTHRFSGKWTLGLVGERGSSLWARKSIISPSIVRRCWDMWIESTPPYIRDVWADTGNWLNLNDLLGLKRCWGAIRLLDPLTERRLWISYFWY